MPPKNKMPKAIKATTTKAPISGSAINRHTNPCPTPVLPLSNPSCPTPVLPLSDPCPTPISDRVRGPHVADHGSGFQRAGNQRRQVRLVLARLEMLSQPCIGSHPGTPTLSDPSSLPPAAAAPRPSSLRRAPRWVRVRAWVVG